MKAADRRKNIIMFLMAQKEAVPGYILSEKFGVSRQIIVQDISVLKAAGFGILSTHYGYIVRETPFVTREIKVYHTKEQTEEELNCIVELGGTVVDVFVWHKVYGKISADLNIFSSLHVKQFIEGVRSGKSTELMNITGGYHYHTIRTDNEKIMDNIVKALSKKGYIVPEK